MAQGYEKIEFIKKINDAAANMGEFYKEDFINYSGKTTDTGELYTELVAEWVLQHFSVLSQIPQIDRIQGYYVNTHNGLTTEANSNRAEERIAMALFRRGSFKSIGEIVDYQTPLKSEKADKAGKIDLLSCNGKIVRILELKKPDNAEYVNDKVVNSSKNGSRSESMLRCVLEGYTYLKTIKNQNRFIGSFAKIPSDAILKTSPLVFKGSRQEKEMQDPQYKFLHQLMVRLDIKPFYIVGDCETNFDIIS